MTSEADMEDRKIIALTDEILSQLAVKAEVPRQVKWVGPSGFRPSSVRDGLPTIDANTISLPNALQGRLQPDEWKPLLTSSIIFQYGMNVRRRFKLAMITWLSLLVLILTVPLILNVSNGVIPVLSIAFFFIFTVYYGIYAIPRLRIGARLKADRKAAELVEREEFVRIL